MKIQPRQLTRVEFEQLDNGTVFVYDGEVFLKLAPRTQDSYKNALDLRDFTWTTFNYSAQVIPDDNALLVLSIPVSLED